MPSTAAVVAPDLLQSLSNSPAAKAAGATATSTKLDNEQWRALSQSQGDDQGHSQGIGSNLHGHSSYFGLRSTASAASTAETPVVASGAPRSFLSLSGPILPASRNDIVSSPAHSSSSSTFPPTSSSSAAGLPPTSPFVYGTGASAFEGSRASGSGSSSSYGPLSSGVAIAAAGVRAGAGEALAVGLACAAPEATLDASTFYSLPPSAVSTATDSAAVTRTSAARSSGPSFASPLPITARINESVHYISAPASSSSEAYTNTLTMSQAQGLGSALSSVFDQGHGSEHSQAQGQRPHFPPAPAPSAFVHAYGLEHDQQYQYQRRQQCQQQQQQGQAASVQSTFTGPMGTESANSFNMPSGSGSTSGGSGGGTAGSSGAGSSRSGTGAADTSTGMSSAADEFSTYASPPSSAGDAGPASTPGPGPNAGRKANTRGSRLGAQLAKSISPAGLGSDPGAQEAHYQQHSHPPTGSAGGAGTASENAWSGSANGSVGSQPLSQFSEIGRTSSATAVASAEAFGGAGAEMGNMTGTVPFPSAAKSLPYAGGAIAAESLHFVDARSPLAPSEGAGGRDDGTFFITAGGGNPAGPSKYGSPAQAGSTTTNNPISGSAALGQSRSPSSSSGGSRVASLASRWGGTTLASSGGSIAGTGTVSSTSTAAGASGPASAAGTYAPDEASAPGNGSGRSISSAFGFRTPKRQTTLDSLSSSSGGYRASKVRAAFEPGSSEAESEPRTLPGSRPRTRVGGEGAAETAATPTPMASSSDFDSGNVAFANSDTEGDRVVHAKNGSLSPTVETRRRDSRLGKASSHSDLLFFAASQAQSQPNSHTLSPTNVTSPRRSPSSGIPVSPNADRLPLDSASSLQQRFAAARAAGRLSRLQYNRPDSEQTSDWEAMRGATSPPLGTTSAVAAAAADRGNSSIVDNVKEDDNISSARRPLDGSTPSSMSPSSTRQQRELLLPVLQGARNGQAFLKDDPNPYFSAISVAASRNGGIGDGVGGGEQQAPTRLKRNDEELDSGAGGPEPAGFLSPQSHSHDVTSVASTRSTMPSASLPLSPPSSATATEPSSRSHDASLGSSLRTGLLSDRDIAILGAIPGSPPESLLNADGTPLNSKNILTIALQKAQNAVMLDGANNVPEAIAAYKQAVRLLQEVMERISPRPGKKTRSSREEERRRLRVIHDTYADRIRLLSMIYVSEDGVELSASSSPLASLAGDWLPSPAVERVGVMPTEKSGEVVTGPGPKVVDSNEQPSRLHASTPSSGSHHEALAKHHAAYSEPRLSKDSSKGRRSVRAASFETARYDGAQTLDAAPAIAIAPGSPMDADPSGTYGGHQGERKDGAAAKDTPVRSRASSDASACSRYSSAKLSPQNALKNLQGPTSEAPFLSARSQAFGLDEEVKTPATPYFDVDPNLVSEDGTLEGSSSRITPAMASVDSPQTPVQRESQRASRLQRSMSSPSLADDATAATKRPYMAPLDLSQRILSRPLEQRAGELRTPASAAPLLVSPTTSGGTISQRRRGLSSTSRPSADDGSCLPSGASPPILGTAISLSGFRSKPRDLEDVSSRGADHSPDRTPSNTIIGRQRATSQPSNRRPSLPSVFFPNAKEGGQVPPVPALSRQAVVTGHDYGPIPSRLSSTTTSAQPGYRFPTQPADMAQSPNLTVRDTNASHRAAIARDALFPGRLPSNINGPAPSYTTDGIGTSLSWLPVPPTSPTSPGAAASLPSNIGLRPFVTMRLLHATLVSHGFLSRRLHIASPMWAQQTSKLVAIDSKVKALDILGSAVDALDKAGDSMLGGNANEESGYALVGARFAAALEDFESLIDDVQNTLAKKLNFIPTVSGKKGGSSLGALGSRLTRSLGVMTNSNKSSADGPLAYAELLLKLFMKAQMFERHAHALGRAQMTGLGMSGHNGGSPDHYGLVSAESRAVIEVKLKRVSDFFGGVILAFVLRDLGVLLEKNLKRCTAPLIE